jgi:hypothetical protein
VRKRLRMDTAANFPMFYRYLFIPKPIRRAAIMTRKTRGSLINSKDVNIVHTVAKTSRNLFLLGIDRLTKMDKSHRKQWILDIIKFQSSLMAIDVLSFSVMSNHMHQMLRDRPDVVRAWSNHEVARRWLTLCPKSRKRLKIGKFTHYIPIPPTTAQIDELANDAKQILKIREQLSSISWWMRLLCQKVAQRANKEDGGGLGPLWKGRFHATLVDDVKYSLSCSLYIDLNAMEANISKSIDDYEYTSAKLRLDMLRAQQSPKEARAGEADESVGTEVANSSGESGVSKQDKQVPIPRITRWEFLSAVKITALSHQPELHTQGFRCSDKGFLDITVEEYLDVLQWCIKNKFAQTENEKPGGVPEVLSRHKLDAQEVFEKADKFGDIFRYRTSSPCKEKPEKASCESPPTG